MCHSSRGILLGICLITLFTRVALSQEPVAGETSLPTGFTAVQAGDVQTRDAVWAVFVQTVGAEDAG